MRELRGCSGIRFFVVYLEVLTIAKLDHQLNEEIRDKEVRLIGAKLLNQEAACRQNNDVNHAPYYVFTTQSVDTCHIL